MTTTKVVMAKLTYKHPSADVDYNPEINTFYGEDAREKALAATAKHPGYIMTIQTIEKVN